MEEHKNIINTYYSIYSKQLDDMIYQNLNNSKTGEVYSKTYSEINRNLLDNQTNTTPTLINDIIDKNMDTFLKSIEFTHKFYYDVIQSYYNYIMTIKKLSEKWYYYLVVEFIINTNDLLIIWIEGIISLTSQQKSIKNLK